MTKKLLKLALTMKMKQIQVFSHFFALNQNKQAAEKKRHEREISRLINVIRLNNLWYFMNKQHLQFLSK